MREPRGGIDARTASRRCSSRIDLLSTTEKAALQAGAVIGRVFWPVAVHALAGEDAEWSLLEERDFIRRRPASSFDAEREYAIKHALTREVAYATLPKARRAHLRAAFAEWLERRADGRDELTPLVAHHYAEAVSPDRVDLAWGAEPGRADALRERARRWLRQAAALAVRRYEIDPCSA